MDMANYLNRWINLNKVFPVKEIPKNISDINETTFTQYSNKWTKYNQINQTKKQVVKDLS